MHTLTIQGKTLAVFPSSEPEAPVVYLNTFPGVGQQVFQAAQGTGCPPFSLVAISGLDWEHDMAPWNCPPVHSSAQPCTGGADDYLELLTQELIPAAERELAGPPRWRGIAGYSLAGLLAVYSIYRTQVFSRVGSMSGSLWFPGMKEYIFTHEPQCWPDCMYFSLGNRESKTRNPVLQTTRQNTEEIQCFYQSKGVQTVFQLNPGNHFNHAVERTAAGIVWMLSR